MKVLLNNVMLLLSAANAISGLSVLSQIISDPLDSEEMQEMMISTVEMSFNALAGDMQGLEAFTKNCNSDTHYMSASYLYCKLLRARGEIWHNIFFDSCLTPGVKTGKFEFIMGLLIALGNELNTEIDTSSDIQLLLILKKLSLQDNDPSAQSEIINLIKTIDPAVAPMSNLN